MALLSLVAWALRDWYTAFSFGRIRRMHEVGKQHDARHETAWSIEHMDLAVGCMLLGSVTIQMIMFYLVNNSDPDIKAYSWEIINSTVTIFAAVMLFQGFNGVAVVVTDHFCIAGLAAVVARYAQYAVMHGSISFLACQKNRDAVGRGNEDAEQKMKCWAALLAHISAFAAISAGCAVQQAGFAGGRPAASFIAVAINGALLFFLFRASDVARCVFSSMGYEEQAAEWDEEGEEAENDIAALSLSFLSVRALCCILSGVIAEEEALVLTKREKPVQWVLILIVVGILCIAATALIARALLGSINQWGDWEETTGVDLTWSTYLRRWTFVALSTTSMGTAWCFLLAGRWCIARKFEIADIMLPQSSTIKSVCLALVISVLAFLGIFIMTWMIDSRAVGKLGHQVMRRMLHSLGVLIGFSWEQAFDSSVEVIADLSAHWGFWYPVFIKFVLGLVIAAIVVPAWRLYILKAVLRVRGDASMKARALNDSLATADCIPRRRSKA